MFFAPRQLLLSVSLVLCGRNQNSLLSSTVLHEALQCCLSKKATPFRHKRYHGCYEYLYKVILFVVQASVMQEAIFMTKLC